MTSLELKSNTQKSRIAELEGTVHILRKQILRLYRPPSPTYISIFINAENFLTSRFSPHTVILPDRTLKNGVTSILPSSITRNSSAPNTKRIFESCEGFLRAGLQYQCIPDKSEKLPKWQLLTPPLNLKKIWAT